MVAHQLVALFVIGQRHRTGGAFRHETAVPAQQEGSKPPLVEEQDGFAARLSHLKKLLREALGEHGAGPLAKLRGHINDPHLGHAAAIGPRGKADPMPGGVIGGAAEGLDAWGSTAKD